MPRTLPVQKRRDERGMAEDFTIPVSSNPRVQSTALRSVPTGAPARIRIRTSRTLVMPLEKSKTLVIRYHPVRDSRVLATEPKKEKRWGSPKIVVAVIVPSEIAGNKRHPHTSRSPKANPLEGQRGAANVPETL
jgi:hypothetical protein